MEMNPITGANVYDEYQRYTKTSAKKNTQETDATAEREAVYEKSSSASKKATYSINQMSTEDRAALVQQLKQDQESKQQNLISIVRDMMNGQAKSYSQATGDDSIWRFLASGDFTVDAQTKAQAQADIAEDGYWGVKQTSDRILDFAKALSGGDSSKADELLNAFKKGFEQATRAWGGKLPQLCQDTYDAVVEKFSAWKDGQ